MKNQNAPPATMTEIDFSAPENEGRLAYAQLLRTVEDLHTLLRERDEAYAQLQRAQHETLYRLALAAEYKDGDTGVHLVRIGAISAEVARLLGLSAQFSEAIRHAAPMHDVGKIGIPDAVLKKPGALTHEEWAVMREHPAIGARILGGSDIPVLQLAADVAATHHERFDGKGYPNGLKGEAIPVVGRIVSLADYFDALTMDRCYRPKYPDEHVQQMILAESGKHFDPKMVDIFMDHWSEITHLRDDINANWSNNQPLSAAHLHA